MLEHPRQGGGGGGGVGLMHLTAEGLRSSPVRCIRPPEALGKRSATLVTWQYACVGKDMIWN